MGLKFIESHEVAYYECDLKQTMTVPMLLSVMIKTGESQTKHVTDPALMRNCGLGWIITEHDMHIKRLPKQGETIYITTQAEEYNKFFCYRHFYVHDVEGEELADMSTVFAIMDLHTRKVTPVTEEWIAPYQSQKITKIHRYERFQPLENPVDESEYRVRFFDLDGNGHVNNAKYLNWLLDALDFDYLVQHQPTHVHIKFDKEVEYGETITSTYSIDGNRTHHTISVNDQLSAQAMVEWRSREDNE